MDKIYFLLFLVIKDLPDFERISKLSRFICRMRAFFIGQISNKKVAENVLIYHGFNFTFRMKLEIGRGTKIYPDVSIIGKECRIGERTVIFNNTEIDATSSVVIGSNACIGTNCEIYSHVHNYSQKSTPIFDSEETDSPSEIESDVLLYNNAKIMPGVKVRQGAIIGNSSVVYKDTDTFAIYVGNPARKVEERK